MGTAKFANRLIGSDIRPFEVLKEVNEKKLIVREMYAVETEESKAKRLDAFIRGGFVGHTDNEVQEWVITSNPSGHELTIRLHKDGYWYSPGGNKFMISDKPKKFHDFNF